MVDVGETELPEGFNHDLEMGVLFPEEIGILEKTLRRVFVYLSGLRKETPLAIHIQNPKIPRIMSESAVINIRSKLFPGSLEAHLGGRQGDIVLRFPEGERLVEVKATGMQGYEKLGKKDLSADYLVWIHFGTSLQDGQGRVTLYKVTKPASMLSLPPGKQFLDISLGPFLEKVEGKNLEKYTAQSLAEIVKTYGGV